jgi:regulator of sigma E protease
MSFLWVFPVLFVLVLAHELGHFLTARWAGVRVLEFGVGYPPRIFALRRGGTEYSLNLLPLGGFVRLLGEEDPSDPRSLAARPPGIRLIILGAGAMMNALLPLLLFTAAYAVPHEVVTGQVVVQSVARIRLQRKRDSIRRRYCQHQRSGGAAA